MLSYNLTSGFRAGLAGVRSPRALAFAAPGALKSKIKTLAVSAAAGWCGVIGVGAVLMSHEARQTAPALAAPAVAAAPAPKAAPAPTVAKADPIAAAVASSAPPPAPQAKSTQRVDMTPTGAIPSDPPAKPKHKPKKKKTKALDNNP